MGVTATNPGSASTAANSTNGSAQTVGQQTSAAEDAASAAKSAAGDLPGFGAGCDALSSDLIDALNAAEGAGVDTGDGIGESANDAVETDATTAGNYNNIDRPMNVELV